MQLGVFDDSYPLDYEETTGVFTVSGQNMPVKRLRALSDKGIVTWDSDKNREWFYTSFSRSVPPPGKNKIGRKKESLEGISAGRLVSFDEVKDEAGTVIYSAVMDSDTCDNCRALDGTEYGPGDFGKAPNNDCTGECRCVELVIFDTGGSVRERGGTGFE